MQEPLLKSVIFHLVIAILLVASSWSIFSRKEKIPEIKPIVVELAPMGDITNVKPAPKREVTPPKPKPPAPKKPEPKKPEPKKAEPKKPEPKKTPVPKKEEPKKEKPKEKDPLDEMLKNLDEPKKKEEPKQNNELNDLLKDLDNKPEATKSTDAKDTNPNSKSDLPFDPNSPETLAVIDYVTKLIIDQIKPCWSPPAGGVDAKNMVVRVDVDIALDGTMKFVGFNGAGSGPVYQVSSDAARRAILDPVCNPLKTLPPPDKYHIWKEMTLTFDPRELIY